MTEITPANANFQAAVVQTSTEPAPSRVTISVEVDLEKKHVELVLEPVKVRAYLDGHEAGDLAAALVKAATALRAGARVERQEVTIPREGPLLPKPGLLQRRTPRHNKPAR